MFWYLTIITILIYLINIAFIGYSKGINTDKVVLPISLFVLAFFMCLRSIEIGADTKQYVYVFSQINSMSFKELFSSRIFILGQYETHFEYGSRILFKIVGLICDSNQSIIVFTSLIIVFLLGILIKEQSTIPICSIWLYVTLGVFQTQMNLSRNAIAIFICYLGIRFIKEKRLVPYLITIAIASTIHISSIIFFPLYFLYNNIKIKRKHIVWILGVGVIIGLSFSIIRPFLIDILPPMFSRYLIADTSRFVSLIVAVFHLFLYVFVLIMVGKDRRDLYLNNNSIGLWMFLLEMLFFSIGYEVSAALRIASLFSPYLIVSIPEIIGEKESINNKKMIHITMLMIVTLAQYYIRLRINNIGTTMPYEFFWT